MGVRQGMDRRELERYILETYPAQADRPWLEYPGHQVFRHSANRKWFVLAMTLSRDKLGLPGEGTVEAVNLKADPRLIDAMVREPGFFPAYHMNKAHWITAALDGSADDEKLKFLLEMSYQLTRVRKKAPKEG